MTFDNSTSKNFQYSTVAVPPTPPVAGLSLSVQPGDGAKFAEAPFWATLCAPETQPLGTNAEVIRVTAKNGDKFTIERAQQGSVAQAVTTGWSILAGDTAQSWLEVHAAIEANATAISAETIRAEAAETANASAITAEATARKTAVTTAEATAATGAATAEANAITAATSKANAAQAAAEAASDPAGEAASAVAAHVAAIDPHGDRAFATAAIATEAALLVPLSSVGAASGVAGLTSAKRLPVAQLPTNVLSGHTVIPVEQYGASVSKTAAENNPYIKEAIEAAEAVNGMLFLSGVYPISEELVVKAPISIWGTGISALYGKEKILGIWGFPGEAPYLVGAGFLQEAPKLNGLKITAAGCATNLRDFGVKFADSNKFKETGHGILWEPPVVSTFLGNGPFASKIDNVYVYGHDGNHYAYDVTNMLFCNFTGIQGFGGGGIRFKSNGNASQTYGNTTVIRPYLITAVEGTAHAMKLEYVAAKMNYFDLVSPQLMVYNVTLAGINPPLSTQLHISTNDRTNISYLNLLFPDFENSAGVGGTLLPYITHTRMLNNYGPSVGTQSFENKVVQRNEIGRTATWTATFALTPTAGEAALVKVYKAKEASMSGKIQIAEVGAPAGTALDSFKIPATWEIPPGEYMEVEMVNATRSFSKIIGEN